MTLPGFNAETALYKKISDKYRSHGTAVQLAGAAAQLVEPPAPSAGGATSSGGKPATIASSSPATASSGYNGILAYSADNPETPRCRSDRYSRSQSFADCGRCASLKINRNAQCCGRHLLVN
jgi:hypothetical protein